MSEVRGRPFAAGNQFGRGRPKGSRNKSTLAVEALFAQHGEAVAKKCIFEAMKGDSVALRLCMERIIAARRGALVQLRLGGTATAAEVDAASQKVLHEVATGQITPEDGETLSRILEVRGRLIEIRDLEARIEKLEEYERERKKKAA